MPIVDSTPSTQVEAITSDNYNNLRGKTGDESLTSVINQQVDFGGTVTFKVDAPPGISLQWLTDYLNSSEFKDKVYKMVDSKAIELEKKKYT